MNKDKELLKPVKWKKLQYIGHVVRGERYEIIIILIIDGKIERQRLVGRPNSWIKTKLLDKAMVRKNIHRNLSSKSFSHNDGTLDHQTLIRRLCQKKKLLVYLQLKTVYVYFVYCLVG